MRKSKKGAEAFGVAVLLGLSMAVGFYLVGEMILAWILVKGVLPEGVIFPVTAALCFVGVFLGGLLTVRKTSWMGPLLRGLLVAGAFSVLLVFMGLAFWDGITWNGKGGGLLLCAVAGGTVSAIVGGKRKRGLRRKLG